MKSNEAALGGGLGPVPLLHADPLASHPLFARATRIGQRMRQADRDRPWALDTAVTAAVFLVFCLPDLMHPGAPDGVHLKITRLPPAGALALQAGLLLPLLWRRRTPSLTLTVILSVFLLQWSRILVLTTFDVDEYAHAALRAGASGFLLKDARPEELLSGIRAVAKGDAVIAPALTRRLLDTYGDRLLTGTQAGADPRWRALTDREREILTAIGEGWTNGEIAERLVLSESTVKTHVGRVLAKIGARDRVQAVIFAYDLGLTRPNASG